MHRPAIFALLYCHLRRIAILLLLLLGLSWSAPRLSSLTSPLPAAAQTNGQVEILTGHTSPGKDVFYILPNLKKGTSLYVYADGTAGNLDPFIALSDTSLDRQGLARDFNTKIDQAIEDDQDPLAVIPDFANKHFLAWDDDSGNGYAAAFTLNVPADGDYQLIVSSSPAKDTLGHYRLLVGLNEPQVLTGDTEPTGDAIAILDTANYLANISVEEITGALTEETNDTFFTFNDFEPGDTLYVFLEATSGNLRPIIFLEDFGNKPLASGNYAGQHRVATLQYTFDEGGDNFRLEIVSCCKDDKLTSGDYRLLVGVNDPAVLTGQAVSTGDAVTHKATAVGVGFKMQQITGVDQKSENFDVVASLQLAWQDPALAFSPDTCHCDSKTFTGSDFIKFVEANDNKWPAFTLFNQQGNRWTQNDLVTVFPDGRATYFERFTTTFQAPDFNFRRFPFDSQQFFIHIDLLSPEELYYFTNLEEFSEIGPQLGEEEWVITESGIEISSQIASTRAETSRLSFGFNARRNLNFYIFRIFVPIAIIIIVSWIVFFLKDYGKRVEAASANLLVFIAFNFTISDNLPRLGYLTLLDIVLVSTFIVTSLVLVFSVFLKRLEVEGKARLVHQIDRNTLWAYPVAYIAAFLFVTLFFT